MIGFTQDGASRTAKTGVSISMLVSYIASAVSGSEVPGLDDAVPGFTLSMSIGTICDSGTNIEGAGIHFRGKEWINK
jgi:hypothetical protein